ncbi:Crp/Fnr family transcriptional regulator [Lacihabitans sp. LS3-19]|uniref:Crp/Fnr family transcriptional regulator n=1 Tax=Lacihabitans sp. LS3-19 TaxID=2487335 RepID=UPI0020CEEEB4|nr:Crp/Fnr family transcriptional regulator [Lacihabitans sp. LS3-19]MCP9769161.1 Crp/Fnr family transcriptional regulator [Lacihabitans sp. LS3-19]
MYTPFVESLKAIYPINKETEKLLLKRLTKHVGKAGDIIVKAGEINDRLYFIEKGMVRSYYTIEESNTEITSWFVGEFGFIYIPHSYIPQVPSVETIELLEDSEMISITYKGMQELYDMVPEANYIGRILTEMYLVMYDERVRFLRMMSAQKRNEVFQEMFPDIYDRAPKKYIASFLGLSPETLSRVRKKH